MERQVWFTRWYVKGIIFMILSIGFDVVLGHICHIIYAPVWFNSIGTMAVASLMGPTAGLITGAAGSFLLALLGDRHLVYIFASVFVGIISGLFLYQKESELFRTMYAAAIISLVAIVISSPLNLLFNSGEVGNLWGDALMQMLEDSGNSKWIAIIFAQALIEFPDKVISILIATGVVKISGKLLAGEGFRQGGNK